MLNYLNSHLVPTITNCKMENWDQRYRLLKTKAKQTKHIKKQRQILLESITLLWCGTGGSTDYASYFIG